MTRLLLADRVKGRSDTFLAPLIPALERNFDVRFVSAGPGPDLASAIEWSDIVWLEWCWDHAVWATRSGALGNRPCIVRLHSIEALQTEYPDRMDWSRVDRLITVGDDITQVLFEACPQARSARHIVVPNGIDTGRFALSGALNPFNVAWVGHVEPKKNPMLMLQVAERLRAADGRYRMHVAGSLTDLRTARYIQQMVPALGIADMIHFHGAVADMPGWLADKGVLLSTTMYESFGLNIGEAMAVGAAPVIHDFPGARSLWPEECLFARLDDAVGLIRAASPGRYRRWVENRYGLARQTDAILGILHDVRSGQAVPV